VHLASSWGASRLVSESANRRMPTRSTTSRSQRASGASHSPQAPGIDMANDYSAEVCKELQERFRREAVCRPMRVGRYEPGTELTYEVRGFGGDGTAKVHLAVERFVGGGFAGQVYRVKVLGIEGAAIAGLEASGSS